MHLTLSAWIKVKRTIPGNHIFIVILVAFVFSTLQGVQDKLDDPFDGMGEDDINLETIDEWTTGHLDHTSHRTFDLKRKSISEESKTYIPNSLREQINSIIDPILGTDANNLSNVEEEEPSNNLNVKMFGSRRNLDKTLSLSRTNLQREKLSRCSLQHERLQVEPLLRPGNRLSLPVVSLLNLDKKNETESHKYNCEKHDDVVSNGGPQVNGKNGHSKCPDISIEVSSYSS